MQNLAHRDDIGRRQRVGQKVTGARLHPLTQTLGCQLASSDLGHRGQVEADALQVRVSRRDDS
ncbi:Uncharacterised protein [Mycobacterium tuberculosis]|uniref:Uncharacterized protein n=1 Tax=Mycobacterium tuberculosis TaxID=1773 RepID=A0A654U6G4_MYCTX|nr:Uncharacterised protein [Mycobacterium tuberculosis]CKP82004.1 Uncharacterised protein [Mycobacterium tuberculosis]CNU28921.1 Uncharacterised protein [Mycobacterium tuberculosis]COY87176.1 Uncharacterised protein [Mycobacterium tuberculosis]